MSFIRKPDKTADDGIRIRNNNPVTKPIVQPIETVILPLVIDADPVILDNGAYTYITGLTRGNIKDVPNILLLTDQLRDGMFSIDLPLMRAVTNMLQTMKVVKL